MAKTKYKANVTWELSKEDGTVMNTARVDWLNMDYENVAALESVMAEIMVGLARITQDELEKKKP